MIIRNPRSRHPQLKKKKKNRIEFEPTSNGRSACSIAIIIIPLYTWAHIFEILFRKPFFGKSGSCSRSRKEVEDEKCPGYRAHKRNDLVSICESLTGF